jgi:hypothetical protein
MGGAPLFVGQGTSDEVINIAITKKWVRSSVPPATNSTSEPTRD